MYMPFAVEIYSNPTTAVSTNLIITPSFYSATAVGGSKRAELNVSGTSNALWDVLEWLNYHVVIRNGNGTVVWTGLVMEATVTRSAITVGVSIERMANKVAVIYNYTGPDGDEVQGKTEWASDDVSTILYGIKEKIYSLTDTKKEVAEAKRNTYLSSLKDPIPVLEFEGGEEGARLVCIGLWEVTDWTYYENKQGKDEYDVSATDDHGIGWQLTSNTIGFDEKGIFDINARLADYPADTQIRVSGSSSNNTVYTIGSAPDKKKDVRVEYTATTISFDPNDDVLDSANGLGFATSGEMIRISGAANAPNNNYFWVKTTGANRIEVSGSVLVSGSAGPSVKIEQGHHISTEEVVVRERPQANVTLKTRGETIAQEFQITSATGWSVKEVEINIAAIGTPTDNLRISVYNKSGGVPGTELGYGLVSASTIGGSTEWASCKLNTSVFLSPSTPYYLVVTRTGTASHTDFWLVGLEIDKLSAPPLLIQDNGSWIGRTPDARMPYRIWSLKETTEQIKSILGSINRFTAVSVQINSGIEEREWREGDQKARQELDKLIESGTILGRRIFVKTVIGGAVIVYEEPTPSDSDPIYTPDGQLRDAYRADWDAGVLPAGMYVHLDGIPAQVGARRFLQSVLIDEAEYDVKTDSYRLTPWAMDKDMEL